MPDTKSATSNRVKAIYWVLVPVLAVIWGLVAIALIFGSEDESENSTVQANITPTVELAPTPEPTLVPTKVPTAIAIPTAIPTVVVLHMTGEEYEEWKKRQSTKATATARAQHDAGRTATAVVSFATTRARATAIAGNKKRASNSSLSQSIQIRYTVRSNDNVVGRKQISLQAGRYKLSETSGCLGSELAKLSNDDLVLSTTSGPRSGRVPGGRYILRAIGNGCVATLSN